VRVRREDLQGNVAPKRGDASGGKEEESSWRDLPVVQGMRGLTRGIMAGLIPGGGLADQVWTETGRLPRGSRNEQIGRALGEIIGGGVTTFFGAGGEIGGMGLFATGGGAPLGAAAMVVVSAGAVTGGLANLAGAGAHPGAYLPGHGAPIPRDPHAVGREVPVHVAACVRSSRDGAQQRVPRPRGSRPARAARVHSPSRCPRGGARRA